MGGQKFDRNKLHDEDVEKTMRDAGLKGPKKYARTCRGCHRRIEQGKKHFELFLISSWKGNEEEWEQDETERGYFCSPGCVVSFVTSKKILTKWCE